MLIFKSLLAADVALHFVAQAAGDVPSWISNLSDVGIVVFLVIVMYGGVRDKPWWVTGREFRAAEERERVYRDLALRATGAGEEAARALSKTVDK